MIKNQKNTKGITLIALVITIIVLLILAGVTISMLSGENGILQKAAEAKIKTEQVGNDEEFKFLKIEQKMAEVNEPIIDSLSTEFHAWHAAADGWSSDKTVITRMDENIKIDSDGTLIIPSKFKDGVSVKSISCQPGYELLKNSKDIKTVIISDGIKEVGSYAFANSTSLERIAIPKSVIAIGANAFYNSNNLKTIILSPDTKTIGNAAFASCINLKEIELPKKVEILESNIFANCTSLKEITIPASVYKIRGSAFSGCSSLEKINIEGTITEIEEASGHMPIFSGCLESLRIYYEGKEYTPQVFIDKVKEDGTYN